MTATNHVMTGALIAVTVQKPLWAIPLAFFSHFLLDVVPHFGYGHVPNEERDRRQHFLTIQITDAFVALGLYLIIPLLFRNQVTPLVTAVSMLAAQAPDAFWVYEYARAQRHGQYREHNWYLRFHKAIQWCERSWGAYVEAVYFLLITGLLWHVGR